MYLVLQDLDYLLHFEYISGSLKGFNLYHLSVLLRENDNELVSNQNLTAPLHHLGILRFFLQRKSIAGFLASCGLGAFQGDTSHTSLFADQSQSRHHPTQGPPFPSGPQI